MDRQLPGAEAGEQREREWREQGFPSEEDMLDWIENQHRMPPRPPGPPGRTWRFGSAFGLAIAGAALAAVCQLRSR